MSVLSLVAALAGGAFVVLAVAEAAPGALAWRNRRLPLAAVVLSAALAIPAAAAPTGGEVWDAVLRAGSAAGVTWATMRARRRPIVAACLMALAGGDHLVFGAFGAAVASALLDVRSRLVGAGVGLLLAQGLLRLDEVGPLGGNLAVGAASAAIVALSAVRRARRRYRRVVWVAVATVIVLAGIAGAAAVLAAVDARPGVEAAIEQARDGLTLARDDDREGAAALLADAEVQFDHAHEVLTSWWAKPALAVPVVAQQLRALAQLADSGADLAGSGAGAASTVDLEAVQPRDGAVDIRALEAMATPLRSAFDALSHARRRLAALDSPWLVRPVDERVADLTGRIDDVYDEARTAAAAAEIGPALLGGDAARRYLLLVVTPSELRGSGGIIGNFGEIVADGGRLELTRLERIAVLNEATPEGAQANVLPVELLERYQAFGLDRFWQNLTLSPDFPTVAAAAERLYPVSGGRRVDGVISVDPIGLAGLLELTGPVTVEGSAEPLTSENAARILLFDQYNAFAERAERIDFLGSAARQVWEALTDGELEGPAELARVLGPLVRGRHLQLHSVDEAEQGFFSDIDADGALPQVVYDSLTVVTQNASRTKIDWFLRRAVEYDVDYDPATGEVEATVEIELRNTAPAGGLSPEAIGPPEVGSLTAGQTLLDVTIYTPFELRGASVNGRPLLMSSYRELGRRVFSAFVLVEPESSATVRVELVGNRPQTGEYQIDLGRQPTVVADDVRVRVNGREKSFRQDSARTVRIRVR